MVADDTVEMDSSATSAPQATCPTKSRRDPQSSSIRTAAFQAILVLLFFFITA